MQFSMLKDEKNTAPHGEVLFLGLEGAGKSLLVRRLQSLCKSKGQYRDISADVVPSVGVEIHEIQYKKKGKHKVVIREVGGLMCPLWPRYYTSCTTVIFVVDVSQHATISEATIEIYELLSHPDMQDKRIGVVLNKGDLPCIISREQVDWLMQLPELSREWPGFKVFELSALTGQGANMLLDWIMTPPIGISSG